jgi:hypothetical protein
MTEAIETRSRLPEPAAASFDVLFQFPLTMDALIMDLKSLELLINNSSNKKVVSWQ